MTPQSPEDWKMSRKLLAAFGGTLVPAPSSFGIRAIDQHILLELISSSEVVSMQAQLRLQKPSH